MKTNDYLLLTGVTAYSYLFFEQNAGVNFLVFNMLILLIFLTRNKQLLQQKTWISSAFLCLVSSTGILLNSGALAIIANCCSLLLVSAYSLNSKTSSIFSALFSVYSILSAPVRMFIDAASRFENNNHPATAKNKMWITVAIVVGFCLLFFSIYRASNPLFAENTKWINFDFLSFSWVLFTCAGLVLVYALFYHKPVTIIENWENNLLIHNESPDIVASEKYNVEIFGGVLLFIFLNLMLLILNVGDVTSIWFTGQLPKGITHTDFVHQGVGLTILSIIIAVSLILFLSRKNLSGIKNNAALKSLIYLWILQNLVMLFSTSCRNYMYVESYNFTYKRVGVYVWLLLSVLGLLTVFLKLKKERSGWFLIRTNFSIWFAVLATSSVVNWDVYITKHNLTHKAVKDIDFVYLIELSDANLPELMQYAANNNLSDINKNLAKFYKSDLGRYRRGELNFLFLLEAKKLHFLADYTNDWQSWDLRDKKIIHELTAN